MSSGKRWFKQCHASFYHKSRLVNKLLLRKPKSSCTVDKGHRLVAQWLYNNLTAGNDRKIMVSCGKSDGNDITDIADLSRYLAQHGIDGNVKYLAFIGHGHPFSKTIDGVEKYAYSLVGSYLRNPNNTNNCGYIGDIASGNHVYCQQTTADFVSKFYSILDKNAVVEILHCNSATKYGFRTPLKGVSDEVGRGLNDDYASMAKRIKYLLNSRIPNGNVNLIGLIGEGICTYRLLSLSAVLRPRSDSFYGNGEE